MDVSDLRRNWEHLGHQDPFWAILADPRRHGNRWDPAEFFATGRTEVSGYLRQLERLGIGLEHGRALDFGCGAGRLTQALAHDFGQVDGVDIAESMITLAQQHNAVPDRVRYHHNPSTDLTLFPDSAFDLVISVVVLQHMVNRLKVGYIEEFLRVLRPGGIALFTMPSHPRLTAGGVVHGLVPNRVLNVYRRRRYGWEGVMELHPMRRRKVEVATASAGGTVLASPREPMAGPRWVSHLYVVRRDGGAEDARP